ncbi:MAG: hypothetical protein U0264_07010 [Candidatus Kapaibacterium sp.]
MTYNDAVRLMEYQYDKLMSLSGTFGLYDPAIGCTIDYVLDYYYDHGTQQEMIKTIQCIDDILLKYIHDDLAMTELCNVLAFNYYWQIDYKSGVEFLTYIRTYLLEKLETKK